MLWGNATVAAKLAGYARGSSRNQGYRLTRQPRIQARIAELRRGLARAYGLDAEVLVGKLEALYQRAVDDHNFHAAARCVEIQSPMAGPPYGRFQLAP
ncbi:MAG: terminase small subunit, partial [Chloroflexi bacterium]|nr:terminase small subunit [Chloroflexota bacterium]